MELGNMIFGNSRGEHPVDRELQDEWHSCMERLGFDGYGWHDLSDERGIFENEVFWLRPYYWGECTCGFDQRDERWSRENHHSAECYQTELNGRTEAWEIASGYKAIEARAFGRDRDNPFAGMSVETSEPMPGVTTMFASPRDDDAMKAWRKAHDARERGIRKLYLELGKKYGVDPHYGAAVHCTCSHDRDYQKWREANDHDGDCPIVQPNFWHKPSGFKLDWYKYPLRDSYSSAPLTRELMRAMFADCAASLTAQGTSPREGRDA